MKRITALLAGLVLLALSSLPTVAHLSDGVAPNCSSDLRIAVVVFDSGTLGGAKDDWCVNNPTARNTYFDSSFSENDYNYQGGDVTDIGDHYLMNGYVSSVSLYNYTPYTVNVWMYPDSYYGGIPYCYRLRAYSDHIHHQNIGWPYNNTYDSMIIKTDVAGCNGEVF